MRSLIIPSVEVINACNKSEAMSQVFLRTYVALCVALVWYFGCIFILISQSNKTTLSSNWGYVGNGIDESRHYRVVHQNRYNNTVSFPQNITHIRGNLIQNLSVGFGNQMFQYAALIGISARNGLRPIVKCTKKNDLREFFGRLSLPFVKSFEGPTRKLTEKYASMFDASFMGVEVEANVAIELCCYFNSWRYWVGYEDTVRQEFQFHHSIITSALQFLEKIKTRVRMSQGISNLVFVGIHVRRGDYMTPRTIQVGKRVAPKSYFDRAAGYFRKKYANVHFVICSNDKPWCLSNLNYSDATLSTFPSAGEDMALLTLCDHVIMSVGTFGWWAAWLAGGEVVYYGAENAPGSESDLIFNASDRYLNSWIKYD